MRGFPVLLTAALLGILAALVFWYEVPARIRIDGLSGEMMDLLMRTDTEYAEGYSPAGFTRIEVGMSEQEVLEILGEPLTRWRPYDHRNTRFKQKAHFVGLQYSHSPTSRNYRLRQVYLDRGVVAEKIGYFYAD